MPERIWAVEVRQNGVKVQVHPLYLPNKDITAESLIDGVTEAEPALIAQKLLERGV